VALQPRQRHVAGLGGLDLDVVLMALQRVTARRLGGLNPAPAFLADAQDDALRREGALRGVVVTGLEAFPPRAAAARHRALDGSPVPRFDLELELEFGHVF
jgi:hypothetical protein